MEINAVPPLHQEDNPTGCCPRFHPEDWEGVELEFRDKLFARATVHSAMHIPLDMGKVFTRVNTRMQDAGAFDADDFIVVSRELSAWKSEHLFACTTALTGEEMTRLSGKFVTKVFEGPFSQAQSWHETMKAMAHSHGRDDGEVWFYYTTCPKCAKTYGKNYVVGLAEV